MKLKPKPIAVNIPIHEFDGAGRHRIVLPLANGTVSAGDWVPATDVASHEAFFAVAAAGPLPQGIFTVRTATHRVLT